MCRKMAAIGGKCIPTDEIKVVTRTGELTKVGEGEFGNRPPNTLPAPKWGHHKSHVHEATEATAARIVRLCAILSRYVPR